MQYSSPPHAAPPARLRKAVAPRLALAIWFTLIAVVLPALPVRVTSAASPNTVSGLRLWLDASDPDANNVSGDNPADGALLTTWHDKSGGNRDATVALGKNAGTYRASGGTDFNNAPVVEFARSSATQGSIYQVAGLDIRAGTLEDVTIFTVYQLDSGVQPLTALWGADNGAWDRFFYARHTAFGDGVDDGVAGLGPVEMGAVVADSGQVGVVRLLTAVYDGDTSGGTNSGPVNGSTIYFNGQIVKRFTDSSHATNAQDRFYVGWDGDDSPFTGDIAEVLVYDRALNAGEIATVNDYLNGKYGQNFQAAAPGGVSDPASNDPKLWLRADAGVTGTSNVTNWADQGPANLTAGGPDGPSLTSNSVNGNPVLRFNGTTDQLFITGGIFGTSTFASANVYVVARTSELQSGTVLSQQVSPSVFSAALPNGSGQALWHAGDSGAPHALATSWGGQTDQPYLWSLLYSTGATAAGNNQAILRDGAVLASDTDASAFTGANQPLTIGNTFKGDIAEIIVYTSQLSSQEHARVQSYLALKYGISLQGQNYVASDGTVTWDATTNAGYTNSIAGIGGDEASSLEQLSSRSVSGGVLRVTASSAQVADKEFLVWGDNGAAMAESTDVPAGTEQRLARVWRVQETGETGALTIVFDVTGLAGVNLSQAGQFALLTDSDGTFTDATATTGGTRLGNTITFTNVNLANGAYISLAYPDVDAGLTAPANGATTGKRPTFSGAAEPGSTVEVRENGSLLCQATADGGGSWNCAPSSDLSDGSHTVAVTATLSGHTSATVSRSFTVDAQAPDAPVITTPAVGAHVDKRPTFSGTAEPGSTVEVRDGATLLCQATANGSGAWSCSPSADLSEGGYTVSVTAADAQGNTSTAATRAFTVDTNAPAAPTVVQPTEGAPLSTQEPTFSGTAEPGAWVTVREGASEVCATQANGAGNWTCTASTSMTQGAHAVDVTATDAAGNTSTATTRSFSIDTIAPDAPVISEPVSGSYVGLRPGFSGTAEVGATVEVREGGALLCQATANGSGAWSCAPSSDLGQGPHSVSVTATDTHGNTSTAATRAFTVDTNAPAAPAITSPNDLEIVTTARPSFGGTAEPGTTVEVVSGATVLCTTTAGVGGDWSCQATVDMDDGAQSVNVTATDAGGLISSAAMRAFTVDTTAPAPPAIDTPAEGAVVGTVRPAISGTAEPLSRVEVRFEDDSSVVMGPDPGLVCWAMAAVDGRWSCVPTSALVDGPHTVVATATDDGGHTSLATPRSFTVDTTEPNVPGIDANGGKPFGARPIFKGTGEPGATVEVWDGSTLLCTATVQSDGSWSCTSTADLSEGAHALTIVARDAAGNISETGTLTITVVHERLLYLPVIGKGSALGVAAGIR